MKLQSKVHTIANTRFFFEPELGFIVTQNVARYLIHYVIYAPVTLKIASSNSLEGDAFTKKQHYMTFHLESRSHKALPGTLYTMRPMHMQSLVLLRPTLKEEMHLEKVNYLILTLGSWSHKL